MYHLQNSIGKNAFERSLKPFSLIKNIRSQSLNGDFKTHADQRWYNLFFISKACGRQFNASSLTSCTIQYKSHRALIPQYLSDLLHTLTMNLPFCSPSPTAACNPTGTVHTECVTSVCHLSGAVKGHK